MRLESLLPLGAVATCASAEMWEQGLYPEEAKLVSGSVPKRQREFTAGRNCARSVMQALGFDSVAILSDASRAPILPAHLTLSITHTAGFCAAAGARIGAVRSIGIDAEKNAPLPSGVRERILTRFERDAGRSLESSDDKTNWPLIAFSIKEAFFKAHYQLHGRFVGFDELELTLDPQVSEARPKYLSERLDDEMNSTAICLKYAQTSSHVFSCVWFRKPS